MEKAFDQISNNLDIIEGYFNEEGVSLSGSCLLNFLSGCYPVRFTYLRDEEMDEVSARAFPLWQFFGMYPTIRVSKHFMTGIYNSRNLTTCGDGSSADDGDCACLIAGMAGLIVHEASHLCLDGEIIAHLLRAYYQFKFLSNHGYSSALCCAQDMTTKAPGFSWAADDWTCLTLNSVPQKSLGERCTVFLGCNQETSGGEWVIRGAQGDPDFDDPEGVDPTPCQRRPVVGCDEDGGA